MTDNAFTYVRNRSLRELLAAHGIRHLNTQPYRPRTNGKVERFHQTMGREWAHGRSYPTSAHRASLLKDWLEHYNHRRPHSAIGNRAPSPAFTTCQGRTASSARSRAAINHERESSATPCSSVKCAASISRRRSTVRAASPSLRSRGPRSFLKPSDERERGVEVMSVEDRFVNVLETHAGEPGALEHARGGFGIAERERVLPCGGGCAASPSAASIACIQ